MNKRPLIKAVKQLKEDRINELKEIRNTEFNKLKRDYATNFVNQNKEILLKLLEFGVPEGEKSDGLYLRGGVSSISSDLDRLKSKYERYTEELGEDEGLIELIMDNVTSVHWRNNNTPPYRQYNKKVEKLEEEFSKLIGNLQNMNGKEGTAYCEKIGLTIEEIKKSKNEVLAPVDISIINGN